MKSQSEFSSMVAEIRAIRNAQAKVVKVAIDACYKISKCLSSVAKATRKVVSCIWKNALSQQGEFAPGTVRQPDSAAAQGTRRTVYPDWADTPDANYQYRCEQMRRNVEREISMELLYQQGLDVLVGSK